MRFAPYLVFITLWSLVVYGPIAHWVWGGGFLAKLGALDFAGGTVVHLNAATAALVAALVLGKRKDYARQAILPHNVPFVLLGAGLLWFGWFGFNAGSALEANALAASAFLATNTAAAAAALGWMFTEWMMRGKPTVLGAASGAVAGLVAITPASGFVGPMGALVIGAAAGVLCFVATNFMKRALKVDDSLDVFPVHGVGGALGTTLTGVFAAAYLGGVGFPEKMTMGDQVLVQVTGVLAVAVWSGVVTWILLKVTDAVVGMRVQPEEEHEGLDTVLHNEKGYNL